MMFTASPPVLMAPAPRGRSRLTYLPPYTTEENGSNTETDRLSISEPALTSPYLGFYFTEARLGVPLNVLNGSRSRQALPKGQPP